MGYIKLNDFYSGDPKYFEVWGDYLRLKNLCDIELKNNWILADLFGLPKPAYFSYRNRNIDILYDYILGIYYKGEGVCI